MSLFAGLFVIFQDNYFSQKKITLFTNHTFIVNCRHNVTDHAVVTNENKCLVLQVCHAPESSCFLWVVRVLGKLIFIPEYVWGRFQRPLSVMQLKMGLLGTAEMMAERYVPEGYICFYVLLSLVQQHTHGIHWSNGHYFIAHVLTLSSLPRKALVKGRDCQAREDQVKVEVSYVAQNVEILAHM